MTIRCHASVSLPERFSTSGRLLLRCKPAFQSFVRKRSFCLRVFAFTFGADMHRSLPFPSPDFNYNDRKLTQYDAVRQCFNSLKQYVSCKFCMMRGDFTAILSQPSNPFHERIAPEAELRLLQRVAMTGAIDDEGLVRQLQFL